MLNNLYSPPDCQDIPLDIQFVASEYTHHPALLLNLKNIEIRAQREYKRGNNDLRHYLVMEYFAGIYNDEVRSQSNITAA